MYILNSMKLDVLKKNVIVRLEVIRVTVMPLSFCILAAK